MMVAMYDCVMGASGGDAEAKKLSFAEFCKKHEKSAMLSKRLMQ